MLPEGNNTDNVMNTKSSRLEIEALYHKHTVDHDCTCQHDEYLRKADKNTIGILFRQKNIIHSQTLYSGGVYKPICDFISVPV